MIYFLIFLTFYSSSSFVYTADQAEIVSAEGVKAQLEIGSVEDVEARTAEATENLSFMYDHIAMLGEEENTHFNVIAAKLLDNKADFVHLVKYKVLKNDIDKLLDHNRDRKSEHLHEGGKDTNMMDAFQSAMRESIEIASKVATATRRLLGGEASPMAVESPKSFDDLETESEEEFFEAEHEEGDEEESDEEDEDEDMFSQEEFPESGSVPGVYTNVMKMEEMDYLPLDLTRHNDVKVDIGTVGNFSLYLNGCRNALVTVEEVLNDCYIDMQNTQDVIVRVKKVGGKFRTGEIHHNVRGCLKVDICNDVLFGKMSYNTEFNNFDDTNSNFNNFNSGNIMFNCNGI